MGCPLADGVAQMITDLKALCPEAESNEYVKRDIGMNMKRGWSKFGLYICTCFDVTGCHGFNPKWNIKPLPSPMSDSMEWKDIKQVVDTKKMFAALPRSLYRFLMTKIPQKRKRDSIVDDNARLTKPAILVNGATWKKVKTAILKCMPEMVKTLVLAPIETKLRELYRVIPLQRAAAKKEKESIEFLISYIARNSSPLCYDDEDYQDTLVIKPVSFTDKDGKKASHPHKLALVSRHDHRQTAEEERPTRWTILTWTSDEKSSRFERTNLDTSDDWCPRGGWIGQHTISFDKDFEPHPELIRWVKWVALHKDLLRSTILSLVKLKLHKDFVGRILSFIVPHFYAFQEDKGHFNIKEKPIYSKEFAVVGHEYTPFKYGGGVVDIGTSIPLEGDNRRRFDPVVL